MSNIKDFYDETKILTNGTCNFFNSLGSGGGLHMHRQIEIMFAIKGGFSVTLGDKKYDLKTGDYVIIKPFELHTFSSKRNLTSKYVSPIFPDVVSNRLSNKIKNSVIGHAQENDWGEILSLYKTFKNMSQKNRLLYFEMLESLVNSALLHELPSQQDELAKSVINYIAENATLPLTLDYVAAECCTNRCTVSKIINSNCSQSFNSFLNRCRINIFLQGFADGERDSIESAASKAGFQSPRTFYRAFYEEFEMTPRQYLEKLGL